MAKRATEPGTGHSEVVELNNDARWQARLDEARGRRAEALKEQGREDRPKRMPRKPWEDESETAVAAEKHQRALDHDGLDFHDRMNALQKVLKDKRPETPPVVATPTRAEPARNWSPDAENQPLEDPVVRVAPIAPKVSVPPRAKPAKTGPQLDSLFDDPAFLAPEPETSIDDEPEFIPISDLVDPIAPARSKSNNRPWLTETKVEDSEAVIPDSVPEVLSTPVKAKSEGMPFFMGVGLVALVAMPFFTLLPPMLRGPDASASPVFGLQPAFGITAAMVEIPALTQSGEFVPTSSVAPRGPLALSDPRPPIFSRVLPSMAQGPSPQVFEIPDVTRHADVDVVPLARITLPAFAITQAIWETLSETTATAGRLPDVLAPVSASSLVPVPRP